jgi:hypothetical protein
MHSSMGLSLSVVLRVKLWNKEVEILRLRGHDGGAIWWHGAGTTQISLPVAQMGELMRKCITNRYV